MNNNSFKKKVCDVRSCIVNKIGLTKPVIIFFVGIIIFNLCFSNVMKAQNMILSFDTNKFYIVDSNSKRWRNPQTNLMEWGCKYLGTTQDFTRLLHTYRLTKNGYIPNGTNPPSVDFRYSASALWHKAFLSLDKEFLFVCKLNFGSDTAGADGLAFVLQDIQPYYYHPPHRTIGLSGGYLGYGWDDTLAPFVKTMAAGIIPPVKISPSFAIEFDLYAGTYDPYDSGAYNAGYLEHISYLQDAEMNSNSDNSVPIKANQTTSIKDGNWHCVSILWSKTNGVDGAAGYDMTTYVDGNFRISKHYSTIGDLVSSAASSVPPYVRWGITAACGGVTSEQKIQFDSLISANIIPTNNISSVHIGWEGDSGNPLKYGSIGRYIGTSCGNIIVDTSTNSLPDTIRPDHIFCDEMGIGINISDSYSSILWSVLSDTGYVDVDPSTLSEYSSLTSFPVAAYRDTAANKDSVIIRLIADGDTTYFNFRFGGSQLSDYYSNLERKYGIKKNIKIKKFIRN